MKIALMAHDQKKVLLQNFCIAYRDILKKNELYSTATTGHGIENVTNLKINKVLSGYLGGTHQLCVQIVQEKTDLVIFLRDPAIDDSDGFHKVMYICDDLNIPIATNLATAELLIKALERGDMNWVENLH